MNEILAMYCKNKSIIVFIILALSNNYYVILASTFDCLGFIHCKHFDLVGSPIKNYKMTTIVGEGKSIFKWISKEFFF